MSLKTAFALLQLIVAITLFIKGKFIEGMLMVILAKMDLKD